MSADAHAPSTDDSTSIGRGLAVGLGVGISAGITGALLGLAWVALTQADMGTWVLARAAGLVSYLLLTAVTMLGLVMASPPRSAARFISVAQRLRIHVILAVFTITFIVLHVVALVLDPYAGVGWWGALVPFGSSYRPLPVTLGLLALWSGLISGTTAGLAGRGLGRIWLPLHRLAAAAWVLAWLHGVFAGSDTAAWLWMYGVTGALVLALVVRRVMRRSPKDDVRDLELQSMPRQEVLA